MQQANSAVGTQSQHTAQLAHVHIAVGNNVSKKKLSNEIIASMDW